MLNIMSRIVKNRYSKKSKLAGTKETKDNHITYWRKILYGKRRKNQYP